MSDTRSLSDVAVVLVHHNNFPDVIETVRRLLDEGILPQSLLVVDNSGTDAAQALAAALPPECTFFEVENHGYGPAVNAGIERIAAWTAPPEFVLTSTHETLPEPGAVRALRAAIAEDPSVAAAGPSLTTIDGDRHVFWSHGGYCTPWLNIPRHFSNGIPVTGPSAAPPQLRHWVDGAFVLYRWSVLREMRFRDDFFMYFEETELHARIRAGGMGIVWVPQAQVMQTTGGVPPYLQARNLQRYQRLHGNRLQQALAVPVVGARRALRSGFDAAGRVIRDYTRGWRDGR